MLAASLLSYILTCLIIELTPGPNMAYLAILGIGAGRRAGFAAVGGIALGLLLVGSLAALGVAAIISESPLMFHALRWGGVFYLLWLAWQTWRDETEISPADAAFVHGQWRYFRRGIITNLLNPKAAMFYIAMLPRFVGTTDHVLARTFLLTCISVIIATSIHLTIVALSSQLKPFLTHPKRQQVTRRVMALMLVAIAAWFASSSFEVAAQ